MVLGWVNNTIEWLHDHFMYFLIGKSIIYNMSWEDPRIDQDLFHINGDDVIVTLTSAGDQVLDYLIESPKKVVAVDLNPRQNALLDLKLAALRHCSYDQFWAIFGSAQGGPVFRSVYKELRKDLAAPSQEFWDANMDLFDDKFLWTGACGFTLRLILNVFRYVFGINEFLNELQTCPSLQAQHELVAKHRHHILRVTRFVHMTARFWAPFIAVPASQLSLFEGNIMERALFSVLERTHIAGDNYFYYGQLFGEFTRETCPRYLKEENFETLRNNVDRVDIKLGTLADVISLMPDGSVTIMSLLDHMDWMGSELVDESFNVYRKKMATGARVFWRSFSETQHLAPLQFLDLRPDLVADTIERLPDRVMMYNSTWFGYATEQFQVFKRSNYQPKATLMSDMNVFWNMYVSPIKGSAQKDRLDSFYKNQAGDYDTFRHRFLHGRYPMALAMPTPKDCVWVDMGGGTGSNLEFFSKDIERFKKITVLDLCEPLLEVARQRVEANGWEDKVDLVLGDATDESLLGAENGLPAAGTVDVVTFSYSLTMIPDWRKTLKLAYKMLKPGGHIAIGDFTVRPEHSCLTRTFWKFVFSFDHVNLNEAHVDTLREMFTEQSYELQVGGFPYLTTICPLLKCPWYAWVGRKMALPAADADAQEEEEEEEKPASTRMRRRSRAAAAEL